MLTLNYFRMIKLNLDTYFSIIQHSIIVKSYPSFYHAAEVIQWNRIVADTEWYLIIGSGSSTYKSKEICKLLHHAVLTCLSWLITDNLNVFLWSSFLSCYYSYQENSVMVVVEYRFDSWVKTEICLPRTILSRKNHFLTITNERNII